MLALNLWCKIYKNRGCALLFLIIRHSLEGVFLCSYYRKLPRFINLRFRALTRRRCLDACGLPDNI